jgi:hypothetical protein
MFFALFWYEGCSHPRFRKEKEKLIWAKQEGEKSTTDCTVRAAQRESHLFISVWHMYMSGWQICTTLLTNIYKSATRWEVGVSLFNALKSPNQLDQWNCGCETMVNVCKVTRYCSVQRLDEKLFITICTAS